MVPTNQVRESVLNVTEEYMYTHTNKAKRKFEKDILIDPQEPSRPHK